MPSILVLCACLLGGCKKKESAEERLAQGLTLPGMHEEIQRQRDILAEALAKDEFQFIHDQAYYVVDLLNAFEGSLNEEQKQKYAPVLQQLHLLADVVHDIAGKKNRATLEVQLDKFFAEMDKLKAEFEADFKVAGKKK